MQYICVEMTYIVLCGLSISCLRPPGTCGDQGQSLLECPLWTLSELPPHEHIPGISFLSGNGDSALERGWAPEGPRESIQALCDGEQP